MAPLLFREKKGVNFSCASPASAAICSSIDRRSIVHPGHPRERRDTPNPKDSKIDNLINHLSQPPSKPKTHTQKSRKSTDKPADLIRPPGSSRYLLNDTAFFDALPYPEQAQAPPPIESLKLQPSKVDESAARRQSFSTRQQDQVVVLRVSLHCKGCAGKVKKHISKMEGVTSFNIDMATKKVTVIGNVTPLGVLDSVSKVKSAQFWPSSPPRMSASF